MLARISNGRWSTEKEIDISLLFLLVWIQTCCTWNIRSTLWSCKYKSEWKRFLIALFTLISIHCDTRFELVTETGQWCPTCIPSNETRYHTFILSKANIIGIHKIKVTSSMLIKNILTSIPCIFHYQNTLKSRMWNEKRNRLLTRTRTCIMKIRINRLSCRIYTSKKLNSYHFLRNCICVLKAVQTFLAWFHFVTLGLTW